MKQEELDFTSDICQTNVDGISPTVEELTEWLFNDYGWKWNEAEAFAFNIARAELPVHEAAQ